jgi:hypothetical protein
VCGLVWVFGITSVIAIVLGNRARKEIRTSGEGGDGMALAGVILGWIGAAGAVLYFLFFVAVFAAVFHGVHNCGAGTGGSFTITNCP